MTEPDGAGPVSGWRPPDAPATFPPTAPAWPPSADAHPARSTSLLVVAAAIFLLVLGILFLLGASALMLCVEFFADKIPWVDSVWDVVNTFLVYTRFQRMRGVLTDAEFSAEQALVRSTLQAAAGTHWGEFLAAWPEG